MARYYIAWNADKSEGFITDDETDAQTAIDNTPNLSLGFPTRSSLAETFYEYYGSEDACEIQKVDL